MSPAAKRRLEAAASVASRTLEDELESALTHADETPADRQTFVLSKTKWSEFQAALDAPINSLLVCSVS
jgi:uncharacterized protein (DUF1778 family)